MAYQIALVGRSGTGKSVSLFPNEQFGIVGLPPEETVIVNVSGKDLPVRGAKRLYPVGKVDSGGKDIRVSKPKSIQKIIETIDANEGGKYTKIKYIVVDDAQYLQMFTFMDKIHDKGYEKFNETGDAAYLPLKAAAKATRDDLTIIFIYHSEREDGEVKIKTAGKVVDAYLTIEGMFTMVLYTKVVRDSENNVNKHFFETQSDSITTGKTPPGMFDSYLIPNDMGYVMKKVREYYE